MPYCFDYTLRQRHCKGKQRNRFHKKCPDLAVGAMIQEGKILLTRISRGSSMEIMQIIQG